MRVAEDADICMFTLQERPPFFAHLPAFVQNMTDGDVAACRFDHGLGRKSASWYPSTLPETAGRLDTAMLREDHKLAQFGRTIN